MVQALLAKEQFREQVSSLKEQLETAAKPEVPEPEPAESQQKEEADVAENPLAEVRARHERAWNDLITNQSKPAKGQKPLGMISLLRSILRSTSESAPEPAHKHAFANQLPLGNNSRRHSHRGLPQEPIRYNGSHCNGGYDYPTLTRERSSFKHECAFPYQRTCHDTAAEASQPQGEQMGQDEELARELALFKIIAPRCSGNFVDQASFDLVHLDSEKGADQDPGHSVNSFHSVDPFLTGLHRLRIRTLC